MYQYDHQRGHGRESPCSRSADSREEHTLQSELKVCVGVDDDRYDISYQIA